MKRAVTVEEYLAFRSTAADFPVGSNTKLAAYWKGAQECVANLLHPVGEAKDASEATL